MEGVGSAGGKSGEVIGIDHTIQDFRVDRICSISNLMMRMNAYAI